MNESENGWMSSAFKKLYFEIILDGPGDGWPTPGATTEVMASGPPPPVTALPPSNY